MTPSAFFLHFLLVINLISKAPFQEKQNLDIEFRSCACNRNLGGRKRLWVEWKKRSSQTVFTVKHQDLNAETHYLLIDQYALNCTVLKCNEKGCETLQIRPWKASLVKKKKNWDWLRINRRWQSQQKFNWDPSQDNTCLPGCKQTSGESTSHDQIWPAQDQPQSSWTLEIRLIGI